MGRQVGLHHPAHGHAHVNLGRWRFFGERLGDSLSKERYDVWSRAKK